MALGFSNLGHYVTHLLMLLYPMIVLELGDVFGLSYGSLLQLALPGAILFGVGALPAGWLGDRWSTRGMMALFFIGIGLSAIVTGLASSPLEIAVGLGLVGLFASIYHPVGVAWLVGVARRRGRALGINGVFGNLGVASAAMVAGGLSTLVHWRAAFIVPGAFSVVAGLAFLAAIRRSGAARPVQPTGASGAAQSAVMWRVFWVLGISTLCSGMVYQATSLALPKLFDDRMGAVAETVVGIGGLVSAIYVVGSVVQLAVGFMMDRLPLKPLFIVLNIGQVPLLAMAAGYSGLPLFVTVQLMVALSMGTIPVPDMILAQHTPSHWRGTVYGARFVLALGVAGVAVPLVGQIRDQTGGFLMLLGALAVLAAIGTAAAMLLPRERGGLPASEPAPGPAPKPAPSPAPDAA